MNATGTSAPEIGSLMRPLVQGRGQAAAMLDGKRIVAQLREDRDHDPAHEVAPLGVGL